MPEPIRRIESHTVVVPMDNIDTDQILPARFLTVTTRHGLGPKLFADWRWDAEGRPRPEFALNHPQAVGAQVLVVGHNFGCGSSREHAPWALADAGFKAVVATSFADIFRGNALKNGVLPVVVDRETHRKLLASPGLPVVIDVEQRTITLADGHRAPFPIAPFARFCLLEGIDELQFLLSQDSAIAAYEARHATEV